MKNLWTVYPRTYITDKVNKIDEVLNTLGDCRKFTRRDREAREAVQLETGVAPIVKSKAPNPLRNQDGLPRRCEATTVGGEATLLNIYQNFISSCLYVSSYVTVSGECGWKRE